MTNEQLLQFFSPSKRRIQAIYYILTGKRTTSNLYAALQYDLLDYWQIYPHLKQGDYQQTLKALQLAGDVTVIDKTVCLTKQGQFKQQQIIYHFKHYQGPFIGDADDLQQKLNLAIQVVSHYLTKKQHYYPLQTKLSVKQAVTKWFVANKGHLVDFKDELTTVLADMSQDNANLMANQWTGYQTNALSNQELANILAINLEQLYLQQLDAFAEFLNLITVDAQNLPLLASLLKPLVTPLSQSTDYTFQLIQNGLSFAEIMRKRQIKASTLYEHLLEIAILKPDQQQIKWINQKHLHLLLAASKVKLPSYQTLQCQQPTLTFFEYRLFEILRWSRRDDR